LGDRLRLVEERLKIVEDKSTETAKSVSKFEQDVAALREEMRNSTTEILRSLGRRKRPPPAKSEYFGPYY
jgi:uncharacterized coiled-coil protein SlyX